MVRLFIKQEFKSMQNRMIVKDEAGKEVFLIVGKWGRVGDNISVFSINGTRLVDAKQVLLSLFPKFRLIKEGQKIGTVKKRPGIKGIKNPYFTVSRLNWVITGDYSTQQFTVRRFAKKIMTVEKSTSYLGEFYIVSMDDDTLADIGCIIAVLLDHYAENREPFLKQYQQEKYSLSFMHPAWMKFKQKMSFNRKN